MVRRCFTGNGRVRSQFGPAAAGCCKCRPLTNLLASDGASNNLPRPARCSVAGRVFVLARIAAALGLLLFTARGLQSPAPRSRWLSAPLELRGRGPMAARRSWEFLTRLC